MRQRLLMLRALGLGDFLTGVPAYRALRAAYPEHELILAAPAVQAPLAALTGAIDRVLPARELKSLDWTGPPPDIAVDLHGNGPLSHRVVERLGARLTMLYASVDAANAAGPWWDPGEHEVTRWCRLLAWYGVRADPGDLILACPGGCHPTSIVQRGTPPGEEARVPVNNSAIPTGLVVLHPGASSGSRRWPVERFAAVARALAQAGYAIAVTGAENERELRHRIAAGAGIADHAVVSTDLRTLAALVAGARLVISNDTGTSHLATAYGTPSVTLFGPVSPALWGPPRDRPQHVALWHGEGERPGDAHGREPDPRLLLITVEEVLDAALAVIRWPVGVSKVT